MKRIDFDEQGTMWEPTVELTLGGEVFKAGPPDGLTYMRAVRTIRAISEAGKGATDEQGAEGAILAFDALETCFEPDEFERFQATCKRVRMDLTKLISLLETLAGSAVPDRPTTPPASSRRGRAPTGTTSKASSSAKASAPKPSDIRNS